MVCPAGQRPYQSPEHIRGEIAARLESRRSEIEEAILTRVYAISDPGELDTEYLEGLRTALAAAVGYALAGIERGEERIGPVPAAMLVQARQAARNRVSLETVLRRYFAGYTVFGDFLMQEARGRPPAIEEAGLFRAQKELAALFDRIVTAASAEYGREVERASQPREERLAWRVKRLLAGELLDTADIDYDFHAWHLGIIATGAPPDLLPELASRLDRRLLRVIGGERAVWAWLGGRQPLGEELTRLSSISWPGGVALAIGEPAQGLRGWRLTHRQAEAALAVALRRPAPLTRYADVALLAAVLRDDDLAGFLAATYLAPLAIERDGGETLRQTLRAFFATGRNASSAAATLGVARQTVTTRLRLVEERIGQPLDICAAEIEVILHLADINSDK